MTIRAIPTRWTVNDGKTRICARSGKPIPQGVDVFMFPIEYKRECRWLYFLPEAVAASTDLRQMFENARRYANETWTTLMNFEP